jgi:hypothetical protein
VLGGQSAYMGLSIDIQGKKGLVLSANSQRIQSAGDETSGTGRKEEKILDDFLNPKNPTGVK